MWLMDTQELWGGLWAELPSRLGTAIEDSAARYRAKSSTFGVGWPYVHEFAALGSALAISEGSSCGKVHPLESTFLVCPLTASQAQDLFLSCPLLTMPKSTQGGYAAAAGYTAGNICPRGITEQEASLRLAQQKCYYLRN